jgi:hypothetical protein
MGRVVKSESELISIIEKYPCPASFKEADNGKYIMSNDHLARDVGTLNPKDMIELTVHELQNSQPKALNRTTEKIAELDFLVCEKKELAQSKLVFCKSDSGDALYNEVIKLPVLGHSGKVLGVVTYQRNLTFSLPLNEVYDMYRCFYDAPEAIKRMLTYLGIEQRFAIHPTEAPLRIFLAKAERYSNKEIAALLGLSYRTVDYQLNALRDRVVDGDLRSVLTLVKRRVK